MCRRSSLAPLLLGLAALYSTGAAVAFANPEPAANASTLKHPAPDRLQDLRESASLGDVQASSELAHRLLDRFEVAGDKADLHEALQWIARDWDRQAFLRRGAVDRVVVGHCERAVLRWYWLCDGGE
jgi:hypothetical protein